MLTRRENLLIRPWQDRRYINHRRKVLTALPAIDDKPPPERPHVYFKLKKFQKEAERQANIIENNFILIHHLSNIMNKDKSRIDNYWVQEQPNFLNRIGIYTDVKKVKKSVKKASVEGNIESAGFTGRTRREKCYGCCPQLIPASTVVPEERIPYTPPKLRTSKKSEEATSTYKVEENWLKDQPEFRGQSWPKPDQKLTTNKLPTKNKPKPSPCAIVVKKGSFQVKVKFPSTTKVTLEHSNSDTNSPNFIRLSGLSSSNSDKTT